MASTLTGGSAPPPAKQVPGPEYKDLDEVRRLAPLTAIGEKVSQRVMDRVGVGAPEAEAFIRKKLKELTPENYHSTVELPFKTKTIADVYGVNDEHGGWYIKFFIRHGRIICCSCHKPDHNMTCEDGTKVLAQ